MSPNPSLEAAVPRAESASQAPGRSTIPYWVVRWMGEFVTAFLAHGCTCPGGEAAGRCAEPIAAPPATAPGLVCRNAALLISFALHDKSRAGKDRPDRAGQIARRP